MNQQQSSLTTARDRNKKRRLAGWIAIYILLLAGIIYAVYSQAQKVNTLNFASGQIQLVTSKTKYTVGDTVSFTIKNGLSEPITLINSCPQEPLYAYVWTNNSWTRIQAHAPASACSGEPKQYTIKAKSALTQNFSKWPSLFNKPGIYRIVSLASNYTALPYADFQVLAKPSSPSVQTRVVIQKIITPIYIQVPTNTGGGSDGGSSGGGGSDN